MGAIVLAWVGWGASPLAAADPSETTRTLQFWRSAPACMPREFDRRLGGGFQAKGYHVAMQKFRAIIPASYETNSYPENGGTRSAASDHTFHTLRVGPVGAGPSRRVNSKQYLEGMGDSWGLFVWVSPGDDASVPTTWEAVLAKHRLLFVGALKSGNHREPADRIRLAVDAAYNMRLRYGLDPNRVYVAGMSGGGRVASIVGVAYADVFAGAMPICGADFFTDLPAQPERHFPARYRPLPDQLSEARANDRFVLVTGENDFNRLNVRSVYEFGFRRQGFAHVEYVEIPGMGHQLPPADWFEKALDRLDNVNAASTQ